MRGVDSQGAPSSISTGEGLGGVLSVAKTVRDLYLKWYFGCLSFKCQHLSFLWLILLGFP